MSKTESLKSRNSPKACLVWLVAGLGVAVVIVVVASALVSTAVGIGTNRAAELSDTFSGLESRIQAADDTASLCSEITCEEGWRTDVGNYLRFATDDMAEYWNMVIGDDSYRNGTVVLDRNDYELTTSQRELSVQLLFPGRDWNVTPWVG